MLSTKTDCPVATTTEQTALQRLMVETEAPISDAPLCTPNDGGAGALLLGLLLSPEAPKEPKRK